MFISINTILTRPMARIAMTKMQRHADYLQGILNKPILNAIADELDMASTLAVGETCNTDAFVFRQDLKAIVLPPNHYPLEDLFQYNVTARDMDLLLKSPDTVGRILPTHAVETICDFITGARKTGLTYEWVDPNSNMTGVAIFDDEEDIISLLELGLPRADFCKELITRHLEKCQTVLFESLHDVSLPRNDPRRDPLPETILKALVNDADNSLSRHVASAYDDLCEKIEHQFRHKPDTETNRILKSSSIIVGIKDDEHLSQFFNFEVNANKYFQQIGNL